MKLYSHDLHMLRLKTDGRDEPLESKEAYSLRLRSVYPNLPPEVIEQWFYEHPDSLETNQWLDYSSVSISLEKLCFSRIMLPCLRENPIVLQYSDHFQGDNTSHRMSRIAEYFDAHGTWPVPPIVLANPDGELMTSWGLKCDSPFHLLEGHHRFAVFCAFSNIKELLGEHAVWVVALK